VVAKCLDRSATTWSPTVAGPGPHSLSSGCVDTAWVGVVGTSIGALIGAIVTIWTASIRAGQDERQQIRAVQREDRLRTEDRDRALAEQNLEQRRALYRRMLRAADEAWSSVRTRKDHASAPEGSVFAASRAEAAEARDQGRSAILDLTETVAEIETLSPSRDLVQHALVVQNDLAYLAASSFGPWPEDVPPSLDARMERAMDECWDHMQTLRNAVRVDLGLDRELTSDRLRARNAFRDVDADDADD
jgi:hypothetical protein